jgi:uncharacterized coiled-coil DUF342 family protein
MNISDTENIQNLEKQISEYKEQINEYKEQISEYKEQIDFLFKRLQLCNNNKNFIYSYFKKNKICDIENDEKYIKFFIKK